MTIDDHFHRRNVPGPIDLAGHLRELFRVGVPALIIALVVGGALFGLRTAFATRQYSATMFTQIVPGGDVVAGDAFVEQLRAPFVGLAHDRNVLNQVVSSVDTGWDAATLEAHVSTTPGPAPNVLVFGATADSPELAEQIVRSMVNNVGLGALDNHHRDTMREVDQLRAAIAAEQARNDTIDPTDPDKKDSDKKLADLQAQLARVQATGSDQLTVLATPVLSRDPVSPRPIQEAVVAGLVALIVAAESIVLWRSRVGSKPNRTWAWWAARKYGADYDPGGAGGTPLPALVDSAVVGSQRTGRKVLILLGDGAVFPESAVLPDAVSPTSGPSLVLADVDSAWWRDVDLSAVATAVVAVSTRASDRRLAERAMRQLRILDVPTYLVLQRPNKSRAPAVPVTPDAHPAMEPSKHAKDDAH
jgi:hypothetical protein